MELSGFFFNIFYLQLVESTDIEPVDMEGQLVPQTWWLEITPIYYREVSTNQECGTGQPDPPIRAHKAAVKVAARTEVSSGTHHVAVGRIQFLEAAGLMLSAPRSSRKFLAMWHSSRLLHGSLI